LWLMVAVFGSCPSFGLQPYLTGQLKIPDRDAKYCVSTAITRDAKIINQYVKELYISYLQLFC